MSERRLEEACMHMVRAAGGVHHKLDIGPLAKGWLDQAIWLPDGRHMIVEFKLPGQSLTRLQQGRMNQLKELGHEVRVVSKVEQMQELLDGQEA